MKIGKNRYSSKRYCCTCKRNALFKKKKNETHSRCIYCGGVWCRKIKVE